MESGIRTGDNGDHYRKPLTGVPTLRMMALVDFSLHTTFAERIASFS